MISYYNFLQRKVLKMQKVLIRILALILSAALLLPVFSSCANKNNENSENNTTTLTETEDEADTLDSRLKISDNLPEYNANGEKYRVLTYNDGANMIGSYEDLTGDVVDDVVYYRNLDISDRFNTEIVEMADGDHRAIGTLIEKAVLTSDDSYDIYAGHAIVAGGNAAGKIFTNWHDIDYLDFTKPWWNKNSVEALTINDVMLLVPSYYTTTVINGTYCMYVNKKLAENYNIGDIFETVNRGEWTLEKLNTTVNNIYKDLNGNSKKDVDDEYGLAITSLSPSVTFTWAFKMPIVSFDENYTPVIEFMNQRNSDIFDDLYKLYYDTEGVTSSGSDHSYATNVFAKGNTMICASTFNYAMTALRDFKDDYSIIPYPKYDSQQDNYYSMIDGYHAILGVPLSASNYEKIGIITEAMTAESWKKVVPVYYDVALKVKGTRDEESVAMLDKIIDSVVVDFTYIFDNWQGYAFTLQTLLQSKNKKFASYVDSHMKAFTKYYEKIIRAFTEYDGTAG